MSGLPRITLAGNLVADVELKFVASSGKAVAKCRVACSERKKTAEGEWVDGATAFLDVVIFGPVAEEAAELRKGSKVIITGRLQQRSWETPQGEKRSTFEVIADEIGPALKPMRGSGQGHQQARAALDDPWGAGPGNEPQVQDPPF